MIKLKLYITGRTPRSERLIQQLHEMFDHNCQGKYTLDVLDIFSHSKSAYEDAVIATPTLIKTLPSPVRKLIGDLTNHERILAGLDMVSDSSEETNSESSGKGLKAEDE